MSRAIVVRSASAAAPASARAPRRVCSRGHGCRCARARRSSTRGPAQQCEHHRDGDRHVPTLEKPSSHSPGRTGTRRSRRSRRTPTRPAQKTPGAVGCRAEAGRSGRRGRWRWRSPERHRTPAPSYGDGQRQSGRQPVAGRRAEAIAITTKAAGELIERARQLELRPEGHEREQVTSELSAGDRAEHPRPNAERPGYPPDDVSQAGRGDRTTAGVS